MKNKTTVEERTEKDKGALVEILKEMPIIQVACKRAGIGRATYYRWRTEDTRFRRDSNLSLEEGIEFINDMSESQLITLIKEKKMPAISMWLKNNHHRYSGKEKRKPVRERETTSSVSCGKYDEMSTEELLRLDEEYNGRDSDHGVI